MKNLVFTLLLISCSVAGCKKSNTEAKTDKATSDASPSQQMSMKANATTAPIESSRASKPTAMQTNEVRRQEASGYLKEATQLAQQTSGGLRANALVKVAGAKIDAGDVEGGTALLKEAQAAAKEMPDGFSKRHLVQDIIQVQINAERFDEAEQSFRGLTTPGPESLDALQTLCEGLCNADRTFAALTWFTNAQEQVKLSTTRPDVEARIWLALAKAQWKAQNREYCGRSAKNAQTAIDDVTDGSAKVRLLCDLSRLQFQMQSDKSLDSDYWMTLNRAKDVARAIADDDWGSRSLALCDVAVAQADEGMGGGAIDTFSEAIKHTNNLKGARKTVLLCDIAVMQRKAGDTAGAEATVKVAGETVDAAPAEAVLGGELSLGSERGVAADVVARAWAACGKDNDALQLARSIQGYQRASALAEVAIEQARGGKNEQARRTVEEAAKAIRLAERENDKASAMISVGLAQAETGEFDAAAQKATDAAKIEPYAGVEIYLAAAKSASHPQ